MAKKGLSIWILSTLTFVALIHLADAISAIAFNNGIRLLQLYPIIGEKLQSITPFMYLWISAATVFVLWGITCAAAFSNPVEAFLNKILSDAKSQTAVETQLLEDKSEILDAMNETIESNSDVLAQVKDVIYNMRMEVKEIEPLKEGIEKMKTELSIVKKGVKKLEEKINFPIVCSACGKPLLPEFKICPYCGENTKLLSEKVVAVEKYR